jgi:uncharacterized membrane protein YfcA
MPLDEAIVLLSAAFATSMLSAIIGMAGGITLLSIMLLFFDPIAAVPLHGVIQLVSNGSRSYIQRRHIDWRIAGAFGVLLLPMGLLGVQVALRTPPPLGKALIGAFVLTATWRPTWLRIHPPEAGGHPGRRFLLLGGAVGFVNSLLGATGPLIAPFFLNLGLSRQALVGTKAACQMLGHVSKAIVFGLIGFAYADHLVLLATMSLMVIAGTWVGSQLLERVNERLFLGLYKTVLTLVALRLLAWELFSLLRA